MTADSKLAALRAEFDWNVTSNPIRACALAQAITLLEAAQQLERRAETLLLQISRASRRA